MTRAVLHALVLTAWRDRGALVISFVLPAIVFVIFAEIFSSATGADRRIVVAIADEIRTPLSARLVTALGTDASLTLAGDAGQDAGAVRALVARGRADAGLVIRRDARALDTLAGDAPAPVLILVEPTRAVAADLLAATVQRVYFRALPDAALQGVVGLIDPDVVEFTDAQRAEASLAIAGVREAAAGADPPPAVGDSLTERAPVDSQLAAVAEVAYYAGGVAVLFVLLSAVHQAASLLDDRHSGLLDRALAGPAGTDALVEGRFVFLGLQAAAQTTLMFLLAWGVYGVDVPGHLGPWAAVTVGLALSGAGLSLGVASLCGTSRQAHTVLTVGGLVLAAIGGSMVPRFLMPQWLQQLGWLTPHTWAIEAYTRVFQGAAAPSGWALSALCLAVMGVTGGLVARHRVRRWAVL